MLLPFYAKSAVLFDPQRFAAVLPDVSPLAILLPWSREISGLAQEVGADWRTVRGLQERSEDFSRHLVEGKNSAARKNIKAMAKLVSDLPPEEIWKPLVRLAAARGQGWARCALRSMANNPQTDPRVRISVNEEESVNMGERKLCGMFHRPFYLVDILSKLRAMGINHWIFEPSAREAELIYPTNLALWELFLEMEESAGLAEETLHAAFYIFSKTGIPLVASHASMQEALHSAPYLSMRNLLRALPEEKTARQIVKRASFCGYASALLLACCFQKGDPPSIVRRVEEGISSFIRDEPYFLKGKSFAALSEEERLALFALFPFYWGEYPKCSIEEFHEKLQTEMSLPGLTEDSLLTWSRNFLDTLRAPIFFDHGSEQDVGGHDILGKVLKIHQKTPLDPELVRKIREEVGKAKAGEVLKTFYCLITWDDTPGEERLRAALLLLEAGMRDIDTGLRLVRDPNPVNRVREYLKALAQYRKNRFPRGGLPYGEDHPRTLAFRTAILEKLIFDYNFPGGQDSPVRNRLRRKLLDPRTQEKMARFLAHGYRLPPEHLLQFLDDPEATIPEDAGRIFEDPKILGRVLRDDAHSLMLLLNAAGKEVLEGEEAVGILSRLRADTAFVPWVTEPFPLPLRASPFEFWAMVIRTGLKTDQIQVLQQLVREILECRDPEKTFKDCLQKLVAEGRKLPNFASFPDEKINQLFFWMIENEIWDGDILGRLLITKTWNRVAYALDLSLEAFLDGENSGDEAQKTAAKALDTLNEFYREASRTRGEMITAYPKGIRPEVTRKLKIDEMTDESHVFKAPKILEDIYKASPQKAGDWHCLTFVPSKTWIDAFFAYAARNCLATPGYAIHTMREENFLPIRIMRGNSWVGSIMTFTFPDIGEPGQRFQKGLVVTGIDPQESYQPKPFLDNLLENLTRIAGENGYDAILIPENTGAQSTRHFLDEEILGRNWPRVTPDQPVGFPKKGPGNEPQDYYGLHRDFLVAWSKNG